MTLTISQLHDALNSVTTIPVIPFKDGKIDFVGTGKNIDYLLRNNRLDNGRKRVISVAGTSLIHHIDPEDQIKIFEQTGRQMGDDGILMTAVVPNPIGVAERTIEAHLSMQRPPDVILIMPLGGIFSPEGVYEGMMALSEKYGKDGARFLYYLRSARDRDAVIRLLNDSPHFVGVKVGTGIEDVHPLLEDAGDNALVIWGIGDRSTDAAMLGTKGHTSGTAVVATGVADEINNAQRRQDWAKARQMEVLIDAVEEIRFRNGRAYNYAAVVEALNQISVNGDVVGGDGGPFNPPVPSDVRAEISMAIEPLRAYH